MKKNTVYTGAAFPRAYKDIRGETIPEMLESDANIIYLDADLMSCIGTKKYAAAHPDRAINCGIAEANMASVAAGLAAQGETQIMHPEYIDRGYERFEENLRSLGAEVYRI